MEPWKPQAGLPAMRNCEAAQWGHPAPEQQMGQPVGHCPTSTEQGMAGIDMEPSLHAQLCSPDGRRDLCRLARVYRAA